MSKINFTDEQVTLLKQNKYVKNATNKSIAYTDEFKIHFINLLNIGWMPKQIFVEAGFDVDMVGEARIEQCKYRFIRNSKRPEGFSDTRSVYSGRGGKQPLSAEDQIAQLEAKNKALEQELDFLKKMEFLAQKMNKK